MANSSVSVIIPSKRMDYSLFCCIQSLSWQRFPKDQFEILLVLDGGYLSEEFCASIDPSLNIRVLCLPNCVGRSAARNVGLKCAKGDIIVSLDGDMIASDTLLETYRELQAGGPMVCIGARGYIDPGPHLSVSNEEELHKTVFAASVKPDYRTKFYIRTNDLKTSAEPFWAFSTCNCSYPRRNAVAVGLFDENITGWGLEDQEFGYRLWTDQLAFVYSKIAYAVHVEHERNRKMELVSWIRNRDYCVAKHGLRFANPYQSMRSPLIAGQ